MDNFDFKKYVTEGRIHQDHELISEKKYKQGYDDREDESLGDRRGKESKKKESYKARRDDSYGKFGKRDAEAKGKAKGPGKNKVNKKSVEIEEDFESLVDKIMDDGKSREDAEKIAGAVNRDYVGNYRQEEGLEEDARTDAEQEGYKDGFDDAKDDIEKALKKMKVSELKAKIREEILGQLQEADFNADDAGSQYHNSLYSEQEDVDVDIEDEVEVDADVDVKDTVDVDADGDDIEIRKKAVKARVEVGLSPEEEIVQDSLKAAMDASVALGNDKLADQIGNTITFFTREYVVGGNTD